MEEQEKIAPQLNNFAGAPNRADSVVRAAIAKAVNMKCCTEEQGELIFWLHGYGQDKNLTDSELARMADISPATLSSIMNGRYPAANWGGVVAKIQAFKRLDEEESKKLDLGFVETETAKTIFKACSSAMNDGMPAFIYGASQIGKTTALLEFQRRNNHGRTKYIRMGSRWSKSRFVRELALACRKGVSGKKTWQLEAEINGAMNRYNLLIIDEFHLALETVADSTSKEIVEYIREVYDRTRCGLVLSSTKVGLHDLEEGRNKMLFDQLRRRGVLKVILPDVPKIKDINDIARAFSLDLPKGQLLSNIQQLLRDRGLGVFIKYLQKAHALAEHGKNPHPMTWDDFAYVNDGYAALSQLKNDY